MANMRELASESSTLSGLATESPARTVTYREAVAEGIAREMRRDETVVCLGEDIAKADGVYKTTVGLLKEFGAERVWDTPISEQAIVGAAMGAAMTGIRPVAEIMFSDFLACCWDYLANEIPKVRYMTGGQVTVPLVVRTANGGGLGFGAQHSQATENWVFTVPGLKIAAPSTPADVVGLMASAIRSDDPVVFFKHKGLFASKGPAAPPDHVVPLGKASIVREGGDVTLVSAMRGVHECLEAAETLAGSGIEADVIDLRTLRPLDAATVLASVAKTNRLVVVEEGPLTGGWAGELLSLVTEGALGDLDDAWRITTPDSPVPYSPPLEDAHLPLAGRIAAEVARRLG
jgi:pyruvate dehydrogenase E1 component beta subunit